MAKIRLWLIASFLVVSILSALPARTTAQGGQYYMCPITLALHSYNYGFVMYPYRREDDTWTDSLFFTGPEFGIVLDVSVSVTQDARWTILYRPSGFLGSEYYNYRSFSTVPGTNHRVICVDIWGSGACPAMGLPSSGYFTSQQGGGNHSFEGQTIVNAGSSPGTYASWAMNGVYAIYFGSPQPGCIDVPLTPTTTPTPLSTPTPTATGSTPTPTVTRTPGPTSTPWTTPTPYGTPEIPPIVAPQWIFETVIAPIRDPYQKGIDTISETLDMVNLLPAQIDTRINDRVLTLQGYSPIPFMRGFMLMFGDFEWVWTLGGFFVLAAFVIFAVHAVRLLIASWGIAKRIMDIVQLLKFW